MRLLILICYFVQKKKINKARITQFLFCKLRNKVQTSHSPFIWHYITKSDPTVQIKSFNTPTASTSKLCEMAALSLMYLFLLGFFFYSKENKNGKKMS